MKTFIQCLDIVDQWVWGPPLLILLVLVGGYLTLRLKGLQFRYFWYAHKLAFTRRDDHAQGDISQFQALMTALATTIGIGSITGVATAIATGGVGALFWMWVTALFGMATKYAEAVLAVKYRIVDEKGEMSGGPMYYLERGLKLKWLAILFCIFGAIAAFGTGNMVQTNSVSEALQDLCGLNPLVTGILLAGLTGCALFGGIKSIAKISTYLVPMMAIFYLVGGSGILALKAHAIPAAFVAIVKAAFTGQAAVGGFLGSSIMVAIQMGVSRGVFSSDAGLGNSPIAAAAAKTDTPGRQALISMCSVFITTCIICTITGLVIAVTGVLGQSDLNGNVLNGASMALKAFDTIFPGGRVIVTIAIIPFAYSTILGWAYYGEKCVEYLFGCRMIRWYRILFSLMAIPGCLLSLKVVWGFANIMNGLMAFPNLIGLFFLSGVVAAETKVFEKIIQREKMREKAIVAEEL
jgi:alanine or glycine:cation symporter, AGCS family